MSLLPALPGLGRARKKELVPPSLFPAPRARGVTLSSATVADLPQSLSPLPVLPPLPVRRMRTRRRCGWPARVGGAVARARRGRALVQVRATNLIRPGLKPFVSQPVLFATLPRWRPEIGGFQVGSTSLVDWCEHQKSEGPPSRAAPLLPLSAVVSYQAPRKYRQAGPGTIHTPSSPHHPAGA